MLDESYPSPYMTILIQSLIRTTSVLPLSMWDLKLPLMQESAYGSWINMGLPNIDYRFTSEMVNKLGAECLEPIIITRICPCLILL